jgi:hypothetical protein
MLAVNKLAIATCSRPGCQHNLGRAPAQGDAVRKRKWRPVQEDDACRHGSADMCKSKRGYEA